MPVRPRGALIVIEGLDRAGKSTQCQKLFEYFQQQGRAVKRMRFPVRIDRSTPIGKSIDSYLKGETQQEDHVIHLLFSANRWEAAAQIREDIANGTTIIIDRYYYSGMVYSAAKNNPNLSLMWARNPEIGLPRPDLCICFLVSEGAAAARGGFGDERYETTDMQKRVLVLFRHLLESTEYPEVIGIMADESVEKVYAKMISSVKQALESTDLGIPLKTFEIGFNPDALRKQG
ncbi:MAG: hypothetical protein Q9201_003571 [Fulgogasparrea decipioides]